MISKLPNIGTTIFAIMSKMANDYGAINLSQGFPDFPIDNQLIEYVNEGMRKGINQYAPLPGLPELLNQVGEKINRTYGITIHPMDELTITAGGTQALFSAFTALVHENDEVIIFDPAYDSYDPVVRLSRGKPVHLRLKEPDFHIDWDEVNDAITPNTRAIIINTPHNPSGAVLSDEDMKILEKLVLNHQLYLISDEVYEHIIFDGLEHHSVLKYPGLRSRSIAVFSFGKTFHATGWKIGYMVAPKEIMYELRKVHQFTVFTVNSPAQYGIAKYLQDESNYLKLAAFYEEKRDLFGSLMKETRFTPVPCHGTYFQLYRYTEIEDKHDIEMAEWLTKEHKVASIPSSVFYENGDDIKLLRFCFAKTRKTIEQAVERLCKI